LLETRHAYHEPTSEEAALSHTYLVTGGAGFIGSHLVERLLDEGYRVRVLDNFSTGTRHNLTSLIGRDGFALIEGDVRDLRTVEAACADVEVVFHQAAMGSVPRSMREPVLATEHNVLGTVHVLEAARRAGVRRVVFASSSSVYGERTGDAAARETDPLAPISPYAVTKLADELYGRVWATVFGVETVGLRYFNVFGPRQDPGSDYAAVIPRFIVRALNGLPLDVHGDGRQARDFTYVDNVVEANLAAAQAADVAGESFNIGCGQAVPLLGLIETLTRALGRSVQYRHTPRRPGDVPYSCADIGKAGRWLGYVPKVPFEEGLHETVAYFRGCAARAA
jgi:nucleoside-diphosphate-sugar epimerase